MTNNKTGERASGTGSSRGKPNRLPAIIVAAVLGAALVIGLTALRRNKGNGDSPASGAATTSAGTGTASSAGAGTANAGGSSAGTVKPGETQAVTVSGTPLEPMPKSGTDPAIGKKAPILTGHSFNGSAVTIEPGTSPMLVLFVAHWCPHCQREVPLIIDYMAAGKMPKGMKVYAVSTAVTNTRSNYPPSAWLSKVGFTAPVLADDNDQKAAAAYGLPGYPYFVVLKADGTVAARGSGEKSVAELDAILATALS